MPLNLLRVLVFHAFKIIHSKMLLSLICYELGEKLVMLDRMVYNKNTGWQFVQAAGYP